MAVYCCWFKCDKEDKAQAIFNCDSAQEAAKVFAAQVLAGGDYEAPLLWEDDYAVNVRKQHRDEIKTFNIKVLMSPNFVAELVK